jgi:tripartite-type tricarboxylate transporter receptor subunit TctC
MIRVPKHFISILAAAASLSLALPVKAQASFPERPIKIVVGSEPGSAPDALARVLAKEMSDHLKGSVIVENRAGATGTIGANAVASSPADGYTLLMGTVSNIAVAPSFFPSLRYKPETLTPISMVASVPLVFVASPGLKVNSMAELQALLKRAPAELNFSSPGLGGPQHLAGVMLQKQLGTKLLHVPYKGGGAALAAVASEEVQLSFAGVSAAVGLIKGKRIVPLFVTVPQRMSSLPDVPSASEAGMEGFEVDNWHALFAPPGVPEKVRVVLERAAHAGLKSAALAEKFEGLGARPNPKTGPELSAIVHKEIARWATIVAESGAKND